MTDESEDSVFAPMPPWPTLPALSAEELEKERVFQNEWRRDERAYRLEAQEKARKVANEELAYQRNLEAKGRTLSLRKYLVAVAFASALLWVFYHSIELSNQRQLQQIQATQTASDGGRGADAQRGTVTPGAYPGTVEIIAAPASGPGSLPSDGSAFKVALPVVLKLLDAFTTGGVAVGTDALELKKKLTAAGVNVSESLATEIIKAAFQPSEKRKDASVPSGHREAGSVQMIVECAGSSLPATVRALPPAPKPKPPPSQCTSQHPSTRSTN